MHTEKKKQQLQESSLATLVTSLDSKKPLKQTANGMSMLAIGNSSNRFAVQIMQFVSSTRVLIQDYGVWSTAHMSSRLCTCRK